MHAYLIIFVWPICLIYLNAHFKTCIYHQIKVIKLLGVIELTALCAYVCIVGYYDPQIRETLSYK